MNDEFPLIFALYGSLITKSRWETIGENCLWLFIRRNSQMHRYTQHRHRHSTENDWLVDVRHSALLFSYVHTTETCFSLCTNDAHAHCLSRSLSPSHARSRPNCYNRIWKQFFAVFGQLSLNTPNTFITWCRRHRWWNGAFNTKLM